MVVAFWTQNVTFDSIGDEMSGVFESHFLAFLQGVSPKTISHSIDITACVPRREPQYSFTLCASGIGVREPIISVFLR